MPDAHAWEHCCDCRNSCRLLSKPHCCCGRVLVINPHSCGSLRTLLQQRSAVGASVLALVGSNSLNPGQANFWPGFFTGETLAQVAGCSARNGKTAGYGQKKSMCTLPTGVPAICPAAAAAAAAALWKVKRCMF
jgi:hypothetical protein